MEGKNTRIFGFEYREWIFFVIAGIVYYFLARQYTIGVDDIIYMYVQGTDWEPIRTLIDIFKSQAWAYNHYNGRVLAHCFVQFFCSFHLLNLFLVTSALCFVLLVVFSVKLLRINGEKWKLDKYLVSAAMLMLVPEIGRTFLGNIAHVCNYLWSSTLYISFLYVYFKVNIGKGVEETGKNIFLFLFGVVCGSWQESFSIGIASAVGLWTIFHLKETNKSTWFLLIGFAIGVLTAIVSPANLGRYESTGYHGFFQPSFVDWLMQLFSRTKYILGRCVAFEVTMFLAVTSLILDWRKQGKAVFLKQNTLLFLISLTLLLFGVFVAFYGGYQMALAGVLAALQIACFSKHYFGGFINTHAGWGKSSITALMLCVIIPVYLCRHEMYNSFKQFENQLRTTETGIVYDDALEKTQCKYANTFLYSYLNWIQIRYLTKECKEELYHYCGKKIVSIQPMSDKELETICNEDNQVQDNVYRIPEYKDYYILKLPQNVDLKTTKVKLCLKAASMTGKLKDKIKGRNTHDYEYVTYDIGNRIVETKEWKYVLFGAEILNNRKLDGLVILELAYD